MSMSDHVGKWTAGPSYGPVLSQTDLYLLGTELQINPILANSNAKFHLMFNVMTGVTSGTSQDGRELQFTAKDEPATLPRVSEIIVITEQSPWCTIVRNERGVTLSDICTAIWKEYTENYVTDAEFASLPARIQEQIKRAVAHAGQRDWNHYYTPAVAPTRFRRVDWLRERIHFDSFMKNDHYALNRLGYKAANIFVLGLTT